MEESQSPLSPALSDDPSLSSILSLGKGEEEDGADSVKDINRKPKRRRRMYSCSNCRHSKLKCSRTGPCHRCLVRGIGDSCSLGSSSSFVVENDWTTFTGDNKPLDQNLFSMPSSSSSSKSDYTAAQFDVQSLMPTLSKSSPVPLPSTDESTITTTLPTIYYSSSSSTPSDFVSGRFDALHAVLSKTQRRISSSSQQLLQPHQQPQQQQHRLQSQSQTHSNEEVALRRHSIATVHPLAHAIEDNEAVIGKMKSLEDKLDTIIKRLGSKVLQSTDSSKTKRCLEKERQVEEEVKEGNASSAFDTVDDGEEKVLLADLGLGLESIERRQGDAGTYSHG